MITIKSEVDMYESEPICIPFQCISKLLLANLNDVIVLKEWQVHLYQDDAP